MKTKNESTFFYILDLQLFATETDTTNSEGLSAEAKTFYEKRLLD